MIGFLKILWSHKWAILLLVCMVVLSNYLVQKWKAAHPGSMTVIESQAMDMTVMKPPEGAVPVAVERVGKANIAPQVKYVGSVSAIEEQQVFARTDGYLKTLSVYDGDSVSAGQVLATIDSPELVARVNESQRAKQTASSDIPVAEAGLSRASADKQAAEADVDAAMSEVERAQAVLAGAQSIVKQRENDVTSAKASVEYWRAEIAREEKLLKSGAVSLQEFQNEKADAAKAEAELELRNNVLAEAKQNVTAAAADVKSREKLVSAARKRVLSSAAGIKQAKAEIKQKKVAVLESDSIVRTARVLESFRSVKSSMSGVVTRRYVSPGQYVDPSTPILGIARLDKVRLQAKVSEMDAASIAVGSKMQVSFVNHPGMVVNTQVSSVSPSADQTSRTLLVEAIVTNPNRTLLPGESANITISLKTVIHGLSVSSSAIVFRNDKTYVWTLRKSAVKGKQEYYCTMHPQIVESKPGKCPICIMALVPRTSEGFQKAHLTQVTVGGSVGERTIVLSGLSGEEEVIYQGHTYLKEGDSIFRTGWSSDGPNELPPAADLNGKEMGHDMKMPVESPKERGAAKPTKPRAHANLAKPEGKLYVCPMHPEVTSHDPKVLCSKCGMRLEEKVEEKLYVCPMHPEVTSHDPKVLCSKCGMRLEEKFESPKPTKPRARAKTVKPEGKLYVCPMHPEVTSHDPKVLCSKCGMRLEEKP